MKHGKIAAQDAGIFGVLGTLALALAEIEPVGELLASPHVAVWLAGVASILTKLVAASKHSGGDRSPVIGSLDPTDD